MAWKLLTIEKSPHKNKKLRATFRDTETEKLKHTDFGSAGMDDFLHTKDIAQREKYRKRHAKDLLTQDPTRAGFLSYYLLWNKDSMAASLDDYKRRFHM